ncbi:HrpA-like RNA helicase [Catovirus CTV1]|mgnify:CR=1 FL=1|uniref:HrpA-like RNA helicase n=1 Tax=Catovirus CTV1 TaxID=1977631 RepID=A0A1V0SBU4_9VIRU|nr:HrpA-like RNA helicase [Catovirus CTV1]
MSKKIGILDPLGENLNPLTNKPFSDTYKELSQKWSKLPAYQKADEIINSINKNQVVLIISSTGSGKTVLVPKLILHTLNYEGKVAVTLPKQITTKSAAEYSAKTLDVNLGEEVGYQYKGSEATMKSDKNKLLYATDGTIVSRLLKDPYLRDFDSVCIDEAHERKVQIDFMLYLLKNTLRLRPEFKLVIMSATINEKIFESYFSTFKFETIDVGGERNYPIESIFLKTPIGPKEYLLKGYEIIKTILSTDDLKNPGAHDIIYFITSVSEAMDICQLINKNNLDIFCVEVYSGMDPEQEQLALDIDKYKTKSGKGRKLIMATGVAESSMTFPGIKYVIDSGYELFGSYDPKIDAKVLEKRLITLAQARQRMGRAGRTESGICYHLYTKDDFENRMEKFPEPNIRTSNIYQECLKLISYPNVNTISELINVLSQFIEPPREEYIISAIQQLQNLKLVDNVQVTERGRIIAEMQMDPRMGLAVYYGKRLNCSNEIIAILATIESSKNNLSEIFRFPSDIIEDVEENKKRLDNLKNKFNDSQEKLKNKYGDHMVIYKIINEYSNYKRNNDEDKINDMIYKYFLNKKTLEKAYMYYQKYRRNLRSLKFDLIKDKIDEYDLIYRTLGTIAYAYNDHMGYLHNDSYQTKLTSKIKPNRNSFINMETKLPKQIYYHELFNNNGRIEMNIVSKATDKILKFAETLSEM